MVAFPAKAAPEVLRFLTALWSPGEVRELRIPKYNEYNQTASGYFDSLQSLAEAAAVFDGRANVFITLNPVKPDLLARASNRLKDKADNTTADAEVASRRWLFIDIDPERPAGISSTEAEQASAFRVLHTLTEYLTGIGWPEPVSAASGNGAYALYSIDLPNDAESTVLIKKVLESFARKFDASDAHIDTTVSNAARLVGLIGTRKMKGDSTPDRPHRVSRILNCPEQSAVVSWQQLADVCEPPAPRTASEGAPKFGSRPAPRLTDLLEQSGVDYRQQAPDSNGITWYHVRQCPFHDDGQPFECGVGQKLPDGAYAGHCFHPEGQGRGWQEWKVALGLSKTRPTSHSTAGRHDSQQPEAFEAQSIIISNRFLHEIAEDAWAAIVAANDPPRFFLHGTEVAQVVDEGNGLSISHLTLAAMKGHADRAASWLKYDKDGALVPARPPKDVIEDMLAMTKPLPRIKGTIGTPVFDAEGQLCLAEGYQPSTELYYQPRGAEIPPIPLNPDATDLQRAKTLIGQEWLGDFPFNDEAARAHAIAIALTAITREMVSGPTPLFAVDAPAAGTGKGLLLRTISLVVEGSAPAVMTETKDDDEMRKRITSILTRGRSLVQLDNVKRRLDSAALEGLLTTPIWSDRVLGKTQEIIIPNRAVWLVTGNNLQMGTEIARRTVWIRLDAKEDRPWERNSFKHPDLADWVTRHRHELLWALLVLVQNWLSKGRPAWQGKPMGSFESWSRVLGGILQAAGITGFLTNRQELYKQADQETEEWRGFVERVWEEHGDDPVTTAQLYPLARDLLPSAFGLRDGQATEQMLRTRLGNLLRRRADRRSGDLFWRSASRDPHTKAAQWRVELAQTQGKTAGVGEAEGPTPAEHPQDFEVFSDSIAGVAVVAGVDRGSLEEFQSELYMEAAGRKEPPQAPQPPQSDSTEGRFVAELGAERVRTPAQPPRCRNCGFSMSSIRVRDICGACAARGVA